MNCSRTRKLITGITAAALLIAAGAPAVMAEEAPSADASVAFYSKYVWRGYELSDDSLVIQPSLSVSYKGFGANLWANLDTDDANAETNLWNETDFTLSYDGAYEKLGYGAGWIYYSVLGSDTQEFYATVSYDTFLAPSLTLYYDTDGFAGDWYANLSIGHSFAIAEKYSLDLGLALGYYDQAGGYSEFHDGLLSASMSFPVGEYVTITPELYWSFALTDDAEDNIGDDSYVYGGLSASFSF
ncbi:MAG: hypothetical protein JRD39_00725 [Deltaproteobacteria bacterium]|jgi:uncharacterized protein (TIGR02001 family)|nr:hypothetical protein [Deltaproteobacteria bacterium]